MASVRPLYPLSCPLKHSTPSPSSTPFFHTKFFSTESHSLQSQTPFSVSVYYNPSGNLDLPLFEDEETNKAKAPPPMPPTQGRYEPRQRSFLTVRLDLRLITLGKTEDEHDPRELSEFPDIKLWFLRLDAMYPWLPVVLDWRVGELARYAAMLVPHQMSIRMGVVFNPEALELFVVKKVLIVYSWLKDHGIAKARLKAKDMARMLGFGIGDDLFDLVDNHPPI